MKGLSGYLNLNKVSDDTYFSDLSDRVSLTSLTTLPREGGLSYTNGVLGVIARAQAFQTLQDPTAPQPAPYNRVPQLQATVAETDWMGLTWSGIGEYAYFRQPTLTTGQRVYAWPSVGILRQGAAWYVNARTGVHLREYDLNEIRPDVPDRQNYAIPITSVDAGLVFEREVNEFGLTGIQTLEPRAFYVYIPFRNQSNAPTFDTAIDDFNFAQLFSVNRYLGNDRIGDANQLSLALTSRLLDAETGAERIRVAIGERFYFNDQRVVLNETPRAANNSDFLLGMEGRLSDAWALISLWQYNFESSQTERFNAGVRYTPAPGSHVERQLPLFAPELRPPGRADRRPVTDKPMGHRGAVADQRELDAARPVELLDPRQQDAGGRGGRRVQWRLLGIACGRTTVDDDHPVRLPIRCTCSSS